MFFCNFGEVALFFCGNAFDLLKFVLNLRQICFKINR